MGKHVPTLGRNASSCCRRLDCPPNPTPKHPGVAGRPNRPGLPRARTPAAYRLSLREQRRERTHVASTNDLKNGLVLNL